MRSALRGTLGTAARCTRTAEHPAAPLGGCLPGCFHLFEAAKPAREGIEEFRTAILHIVVHIVFLQVESPAVDSLGEDVHFGCDPVLEAGLIEAETVLGRNHHIVETEGEQKEVEGCLSLPGQWGYTCRPAKVTVRATDRNGQEFTEIQAAWPRKML